MTDRHMGTVLKSRGLCHVCLGQQHYCYLKPKTWYMTFGNHRQSGVFMPAEIVIEWYRRKMTLFHLDKFISSLSNEQNLTWIQDPSSSFPILCLHGHTEQFAVCLVYWCIPKPRLVRPCLLPWPALPACIFLVLCFPCSQWCGAVFPGTCWACANGTSGRMNSSYCELLPVEKQLGPPFWTHTFWFSPNLQCMGSALSVFPPFSVRARERTRAHTHINTCIFFCSLLFLSAHMLLWFS